MHRHSRQDNETKDVVVIRRPISLLLGHERMGAHALFDISLYWPRFDTTQFLLFVTFEKQEMIIVHIFIT